MREIQKLSEDDMCALCGQPARAHTDHVPRNASGVELPIATGQRAVLKRQVLFVRYVLGGMTPTDAAARVLRETTE